MTEENRAIIKEMRLQGVGYKKLAKMTGLNAGTIKTYCIRHGLGHNALLGNYVPPETKWCDNCAGPLVVYPGRKVPRFCCNDCRNQWWNRHAKEANRESMSQYKCPTCGKLFRAYEKRQRKYCSHSCYITARFG